MTKKSLGYVKLEWTCPNCGTKNPGPQKTCAGCGAPQPEDVQFEQAAQEEIVTEEEEIRRAKSGPDFHCAYCGARNPAGTEICTQCGADVSEGHARASGRVVGAHRDRPAEDVSCPSCGAPNPATAHKCSQCGASLARPEPAPLKQPVQTRKKRGCGPVVYIIGAAIILMVALGVFLTLSSSDVVGTVEAVEWTRRIPIQALGPVTYEDWRDAIPSDAVIGTCEQKAHHTQAESAPNSKEVCGTPYTVDKGSGYGEVVQDCEYEVYADWCEYEIEEWQVVDELTLSGNDLDPHWPAPRLSTDQREGEREELYECIFDTDGKTYTYKTRDPAEFAECQIGSRWNLKVNKLNAVLSIETAR
jgi:ribosomal protein L40E